MNKVVRTIVTMLCIQLLLVMLLSWPLGLECACRGNRGIFRGWYAAKLNRTGLVLEESRIEHFPVKRDTWKYWGIEYQKREGLNLGDSIRVLKIPAFYFWPPLALLAIFTIVAGPLLRHRRKRSGLCLNCGYDLRGSDPSCCPECGADNIPDPDSN